MFGILELEVNKNGKIIHYARWKIILNGLGQ
jgi:hypothetical protein